MDKYEFFRQWISPFIQGPAADALINSLADEADKMKQLSVDVTDQLTISTAVGPYLVQRLGDLNITVPTEIGISDDALRNIGITINAQKLLTNTIHDVLEIFYGPEAVRAYAQSDQAEPYALEDGWILTLKLEDGVETTITFKAEDFNDIGAATAQEIADLVTRTLRDFGHRQALSYAYQDQNTNQTFVRIFGSAKGPYSQVIITGGQVQNVLEFPVIRNTELPSNTTVWQVTKNVGQTLRFRWDGGPAPALANVFVGDSVMIYGPEFTQFGLGGTFTVTAIRPPKPMASYDAGWFEIVNNNDVGLLHSAPDVAPPPNGGGNTYSYGMTQLSFQDLKFFLPKKNTTYSKPLFSAAFEPANDKLKIYLPATTKVVERDLVGGAYLHMQYGPEDFNGAFGSVSDPDAQVEIVNPFAIRYKQIRLDNFGTGGTVTPSVSAAFDIDYVARENEYVTIVATAPHGLVGYNQWNTSNNYAIGQTAYQQGYTWVSVQASGPGFGGAQNPIASVGYWEQVGPSKNLSDEVFDVVVANVLVDDQFNPYPGPYLADLEATFNLTTNTVTTRQEVQRGDQLRTLAVLGTLPVTEGLLLMDLSQNSQEFPVRFFATQRQGTPTPVAIATISQNGNNVVVTTAAPHGVVPGDQVTVSGAAPMNGTFEVALVTNNTIFELTNPTSQVAYATTGTALLVDPGPITTLVLDPAYQFKQSHAIGADAVLLSSATAFVPRIDDSDHSLYVTSTAEARAYAESLIEGIVAQGIKLEIVIVYPDDEGLGNWGYPENKNVTPHSEAVYVWGAEDES